VAIIAADQDDAHIREQLPRPFAGPYNVSGNLTRRIEFELKVVLMSCPICGELSGWPIAHLKDPQIDAWLTEAGSSGSQDWYLCCRCANAFPATQPDLRVLERFWRRNRQASNPQDEVVFWQQRLSMSRIAASRSYRFFSPFAPSAGRFLDIACGLGDTVRIFADHGWDAEGIDADPSVVPLHKQLGIRGRIGQFEKVDLEGCYDLIHIAHAIYFITDPLGFMRGVRNRLTPRGLFCVVISDFMSSVDPNPPSYAHTFIPTGRSMEYALAVAGFETVLRRTFSGSIYIAGRPSGKSSAVIVYPPIVRLGYQTKRARYLVIGKPYLALRELAKRCYGFVRRTR
jgi:SAM-dependent methyltransferase